MRQALGRSAALLGFSLGGFFDGILLHQILQWHHLLSDVQADGLQDLRLQVLADGIFHLVMYLIAVVALVGLWRARRAIGESGAASLVAGSALVGFGAWHIVDAVLSHWLTGIHRVRGDAPDPLFWDLLWLGLFGLLPVLVGMWLRRRPPPGSGLLHPAPGTDDHRGGRQRTTAARVGAVVFVVATVGAGGLAAAWPNAQGPSLVVFGPGIGGAQAFNALGMADARVLWSDGGGGVWLVQFPASPATWRLVRHGAWVVGGTWAGLGCVSWTR